MSLTRKEFLGSILKGAAGAAGIALLVGASGCGDDGGGSGPDASPDGTPHHDGSAGSDGSASGANCSMNGTDTTIGANHGHVLTVSKADVAAGADKIYDIHGTATHTHSVTVTAALFTMLQANMTIMTTSTTTDSHSHPITVACAT
jgi:hypothetical protein